MEIFNSIGDRLREVREDMQQTQSEFAAIAAAAGVPGATRQSQAKYEKGIAAPSATYLAAIAAEGVDVLYVLTGQRNRPAAKPLPADEQMWLDCYRGWELPVKRKELARALGLSPTDSPSSAGTATISGNQQNNTGSGVVQIGSMGHPPVKRRR